MKLLPLDYLFEHYKFVIPDYQRGYAWGSLQVTDFWEDINRIDIANPQHFTGTLILEVIADDASKIQATVVDGQQRLTTIILLSKAIAESLDRRGQVEAATALRVQILGTKDEPAFRYGPANDSWPFLALNIFNDVTAVAKAADHRSAYTSNLESGLISLRNLVNNLNDVELNRLKGNVLSKLVFNVVEVDPREFNIHVAFESINHRGKELTKLELLKNRLIYVATVMCVPAHVASTGWEQQKKLLRHEINGTWGDVYSWLGRDRTEALDEEEFLRTHAIMYFDDADTGERDWLESLLFRNHFTAAKAIAGELNASMLRDYLNSLRISAVLWSHLRFPRNMPPKQVLWLNRINHVQRPLFDPVLLATYVRFVKDDFGLAVDLRKTARVDAVLVSLLQEIERFNVLVFIVTGKRSHTARKEFFKIANQLYRVKGDYSGDTISALKYLSRYIRSCVDNVDPQAVEERLDEEFERNGYLDLKAFQNEITKALRHGSGYYGHDWTRVILFEYEESLRSIDKGAEKVSWDRSSANSIEHVYPQNDSHWQALTKSLGGRTKKARVNSYKHSLGNLVLLNSSKNASLQNLPYVGKNPHAAKRPRFEQGSYSETDAAAEHKTWTKRAIEARGKKLLLFAEKRWDFSFDSFRIKYKSLLTID